MWESVAAEPNGRAGGCAVVRGPHNVGNRPTSAPDDVRREVTGVRECDGGAVGVVLGPSAYPSFPILPSLSPYHSIPYPTPLPTALVWIGVAVEIPELVPSVRFTPNPTSLPKQVFYVQRQ